MPNKTLTDSPVNRWRRLVRPLKRLVDRTESAVLRPNSPRMMMMMMMMTATMMMMMMIMMMLMMMMTTTTTGSPNPMIQLWIEYWTYFMEFRGFKCVSGVFQVFFWNNIRTFFFDVLLTAHLSIFISLFNQLDAQNLFHSKFYFMPLHLSSTCARNM